MTRVRSTYLALIAALLSPIAANADLILLVNEDGQLTGANNILVREDLFDVVFAKGNCIENFSGCDDYADFVFAEVTNGIGDSALARLASRALLEQVLVPGTVFGDDPTMTFGCSNVYYCYMYTPFGFWVDGSVRQASARNVAAGLSIDDSVGTNHVSTTQNKFAQEVWAVWSPSVSVPEPGTLALLGIGLLGMGAARPRKKA